MQTMPSQDACLSVRHMLVFCQNGYTYPKTFYTVGKPYHSSFCIPMAASLEGGIKKSQFSTNTHFISEIIQHRSIVTMEGE